MQQRNRIATDRQCKQVRRESRLERKRAKQQHGERDGERERELAGQQNASARASEVNQVEQLTAVARDRLDRLDRPQRGVACERRVLVAFKRFSL